jgi:hypothetical protein
MPEQPTQSQPQTFSVAQTIAQLSTRFDELKNRCISIIAQMEAQMILSSSLNGAPKSAVEPKPEE